MEVTGLRFKAPPLTRHPFLCESISETDLFVSWKAVYLRIKHKLQAAAAMQSPRRFLKFEREEKKTKM